LFQKILIANRGEIAVRVIRTCRQLGIASVAIYSEPDRDALHVRLADYAYPCGGAAPRDSYLQAQRVLEIAQRSGAEAIHPGYGFLAENADFSDRCADAGMVFIGPSGNVIRTMGDKAAARAHMTAVGIPVIPGSDGPIADAQAEACAQRIGFPVMVKASAGGGGKGMRRVAAAADLAPALERVRGEAQSAFGDDALYLEKCVEAARHIEVQFIADSQGGTVALGERECSIQRRHQKLIEEAPANAVGPKLREAMEAATLAAAKSVGYCGAGTCEFLLGPGDVFFFLEMNTRIQVEHPLTEAVTGIDIVAEMIRVAAGQPLAIGEVKPHGCAIETRIYAEDPDRGFIPSPGTIDVYRPPGGPGVRVDSGVESGSRVTTHYDPLIAKLICWGLDRPIAISRMRAALSEFAIGGIATSIPFHLRALGHRAFVSGSYTTDFAAAIAGAVTPTANAEQTSTRQRAIAFRLAAVYWFRQRGDASSGATKKCEVRALRPKRSEFEPVEMRCVDSSQHTGRYEFSHGGERSELDIASGANATAFSVIDSAGQTEAVVTKKGKTLEIRTAAGSIAVEVRESSIGTSQADTQPGTGGAEDG
jgi:acetyl-CoA carboxylase biotin carboxylase subunit